jgi:hypothetical protein
MKERQPRRAKIAPADGGLLNPTWILRRRCDVRELAGKRLSRNSTQRSYFFRPGGIIFCEIITSMLIMDQSIEHQLYMTMKSYSQPKMSVCPRIFPHQARHLSDFWVIKLARV